MMNPAELHLDKLNNMLNKLIEHSNVTFITAESPDQTPDHVVKERIRKMSDGIVIVDHLPKIK